MNTHYAISEIITKPDNLNIFKRFSSYLLIITCIFTARGFVYWQMLNFNIFNLESCKGRLFINSIITTTFRYCIRNF